MQTPPENPRYDERATYKSTVKWNRSISSISTCSINSTSTSSSSSSISSNLNDKDYRNRINCICGRKMDYTQNPLNAYPPNAVLYCQQSPHCKQKLIVQNDWFYSCKSRTSYHGTKDGTFKICVSCSNSLNAKQQRIDKNHQLLIKQYKNKQYRNNRKNVLITKDTKQYILSSSLKDTTLILLQKAYIVQEDNKNNKKKKNKIIKQGFMRKKGKIWNTSFQKRYFKLLKNKQLFYYKTYEDGVASDERGIADLKIVNNMIKKGYIGLEINTPSREWEFLCYSMIERNEWFDTIHSLCIKNAK